MPWYGWVFGLPLMATLIWSFVELAIPFLLLVLGVVRGRYFLRAVLVFATSLWAFLCLNTLIPTAVAAANADGYRPATFTVREHFAGGGEQALTPHTRGVIDGRQEELFVRAGYLKSAPRSATELATAVPVGSQLPVLYNPDVPGNVRVLEPTGNLAGREWGEFAKWAALGVVPWLAALVIRFRWRAPLRLREVGESLVPVRPAPVLGAQAVRVRAADLESNVGTTPISHSSTLSTPLRPRFTVAGDVLTLETHRGVRGLGWIILCWGLSALVCAIVALVNDWPLEVMLVFIGQGTFLPMIGLVMVVIPSRRQFDRAAGVYVRRSLIAPTRRLLSQVLAVQVIPGRVFESVLLC